MLLWIPDQFIATVQQTIYRKVLTLKEKTKVVGKLIDIYLMDKFIKQLPRIIIS